MPRKSQVLITSHVPSSPSPALVRLVAQSSEHVSEVGIDIAELMGPVSMSYAPHLDRADVRAFVDRLAFA